MVDVARIVRSAGAPRMPWKNGGGETVEIVAHPFGLGAFGWRVSLARIDREGPFSTFPGVDRVFAVLDGDGVDLRIGAEPAVRLTQDDTPWAFPGEAPCRCGLLGGAVTALNAMVARGAFTCTVSRLDLRGGLQMAKDAVTVVVCGEGTIATDVGVAGRHDAVIIPAGASVHLESRDLRALGFAVVLRPKRAGSLDPRRP